MSEEIFKRLKAIIDDFGPTISWCGKAFTGCMKCPMYYVDTRNERCIIGDITDWVEHYE